MALKLKSNNTQGNPYHDEEGKFTSKGGEGTGGKSSDPLMDLFGSLGKSMRDSEAEEKEAMKLFGIKNEEKPEKKLWDVGTLDGEVFDKPIEAESEEEAYKIAEQLYPGYGDELTVSSNEEEEKEASKLLGVDLKDKKTWDIDKTDPEMAEFLKLDYKGRQLARKEGRLPKQFERLDKDTQGSLLAGYDESVMDAPSSVQLSEWSPSGSQSYSEELDEYFGDEEENVQEVDITDDDLLGFLKINNIKITPEDEDTIRGNHVIPTRILKETFGDEYTEDDLYEDLMDFKRR